MLITCYNEEAFDRRNLEDGTTSRVTFPSTSQQLLISADEISLKLQLNEYGRPIAKNFESIDSLILPDKLFQMTVSNTHPIKLNGFKKVMANLQTQTVDIYFEEEGHIV
jgi:hypothetical protein